MFHHFLHRLHQGTTYYGAGLAFTSTGTLLAGASRNTWTYTLVNAWEITAVVTSSAATVDSGGAEAIADASKPALASLVPLWTWDFDSSAFNHFQDAISSFVLTQDSQYVVVGSWGSGDPSLGADDPTVNVLCASNGYLLASFGTPGSVFSVSASHNSTVGALTVAVAAKHIHANRSGRLGDLYSLVFNTSTFQC